ncbi:MAG: DUF1292 domain-containing protein [Clostridia bacterium]|nr:DUF1292 domain-containing protein [Clostridia bacterium]
MDNEEKKDLGENEYEDEILILTDEDGKELNFALLSSLEYEGSEYRALIPVDEEGNETSDEYVILKIATDENGEQVLETIEDDEEFDRVADIFDDQLSDVFYDEPEQ